MGHQGPAGTHADPPAVLRGCRAASPAGRPGRVSAVVAQRRAGDRQPGLLLQQSGRLPGLRRPWAAAGRLPGAAGRERAGALPAPGEVARRRAAVHGRPGRLVGVAGPPRRPGRHPVPPPELGRHRERRVHAAADVRGAPPLPAAVARLQPRRAAAGPGSRRGGHPAVEAAAAGRDPVGGRHRPGRPGELLPDVPRRAGHAAGRSTPAAGWTGSNSSPSTTPGPSGAARRSRDRPGRSCSCSPAATRSSRSSPAPAPPTSPPGLPRHLPNGGPSSSARACCRAAPPG